MANAKDRAASVSILDGRLLNRQEAATWVVIAVAAAVLTGLLADSRAVQTRPGPAIVPPPVMSSLGVRTGSEFTDGLTLFSVGGDQPATITGVRADAGGLQVLGIRVADASRQIAAIQVIDTWPPVDADLRASSVKSLPVTTPPYGEDHKSLELLIGYRVTGKGRLVRKGVWIDYTVDDDAYSVYYPAGLTVCTNAPRNACDPPAGWEAE